MNQIMIEIAKRTGEEIAKDIAKSAAIGAAIDGAIALYKKKSVIKEALTGGTSSAAGTGATIAVQELMKKKGPLSLVIGAGVNVTARYALRKISNKETEEE